MGMGVLVLGESGSGKSTSLRNFSPDEIAIFNIAGKPLPFRGKLPKLDKPNYQQIITKLCDNKSHIYVIDDSQYLMAFEMFFRAKEKGYEKFTDIAKNFHNLLQCILNDTSPDTIVYLLHHVERNDVGGIKAKTVGKMLDNQLTIEGLFSVVLLCKTDGKKHIFATQSDGFSPAKSPMGMFAPEIDNDLKFVDTTIREYWELAPSLPVKPFIGPTRRAEMERAKNAKQPIPTTLSTANTVTTTQSLAN